MNQVQTNQLEMFKTVQQYLDQQSTTWNSIPIATQFKTQLDDALLNLEEAIAAQESAQVFVGNNKAAIKKNVAERADILNDLMEAYADINALTALQQKADKSFSDLHRLPNEAFITAIRETIQLLEEHLDALADYGIQTAQVDRLKTVFDRFLTLNNQPRQYQIASVQASQDMQSLFKEIADLLTTKMDKIMKGFKRSQATFYNGYVASRTIVDN